MSVFSGVIPIFTILPGSSINFLASQAAASLLDSTIGVAVNATLGEKVAKFLDLPEKNSNFFGPIANEQFLSQGVQGLSQALNSTLIGSNALGQFGPLGTKLIGLGSKGLNNLISDAFRKVGGGESGKLGGSSKGTLYFPGAGGSGEGVAYWGSDKLKETGNMPGAYSLGEGGPDLVFKIVAAAEAAAFEANKGIGGTATTASNPNPNPNPASASNQPTSNSGAPVGNQPSTPAGTGANGAAPAPTPTSTKPPAPTLTLVNPPETATQRGIPRSRQADPPQTPGTPASQTPPDYKATAEVVGETKAASSPGSVGVSGANEPVKPEVMPQKQTTSKEEFSKLKQPSEGWTFICSPEDISWEKSFQASRTEMWGTNLPPVVGGNVSMRDLTLNNSIVEGFSRGVTVEDKISELEQLCSVSMTVGGAKNVVQIPVYRVYAGGKYYGSKTKGDIQGGGFFIIKSVKVQEMIRDLNGKTVRAKVDVSFMQVPGYQVESGRDMASAFLPSALSPISKIARAVESRTRGGLSPLSQANQETSNPAPGSQQPKAENPRTTGVQGAPGAGGTK